MINKKLKISKNSSFNLFETRGTGKNIFLLFFLTIPLWANCQFDTQCGYPAKCLKQPNEKIGRCVLLDPTGNKIYKPNRNSKIDYQPPTEQVAPTVNPSLSQGLLKNMVEGFNEKEPIVD